MDGDFRQQAICRGKRRPNRHVSGSRAVFAAALLFATAAAIAPVAVHAANPAAAQGEPQERPKAVDAPKTTDLQGPSFRAAVRAMVEQEVRKTGLPADIADAVVQVESNYNPATIGGVGEIGLMQIRPQTAAMLGFRGSNEDLARPEVNIHYELTYLSKA